ncbi:MAG: MBL fold metallo-hydrolase [Nitrososphaera sp.]
MAPESLYLRINGVLPDVSAGEGACASLSVIHQGFHLLVDAGIGVKESLKKSMSGSGQRYEPNAILITHGRMHHIADLSALLGDGVGKIYCTSESAERITKEFPSLGQKEFVRVNPGQSFEVGPFSVVPIAADNSGNQPGVPGSVIYVITIEGRKIIAGWDFLKLPNADERILWNPDLLVLGTESYNEHPSTGMISVSEAYSIVRRWNAKSCYILHYSGEKDREDAKNQWHRGPAGPLSLDELQNAVDEHLRISGQEGKFVIKVAGDGTTWTPQEVKIAAEEDDAPIGPKIEVEALEKYIISIEKTQEGKVAVAIEDAINRMTAEFLNPKVGENSLHGDAIKNMMMKGPELQLVVSGNSVKVDITKGKKPVFAGNIPVSERDSKKLVRYLHENFQ